MPLATCSNQSELAEQRSGADLRIKNKDIKSLLIANRRYFYTLYLLIDSSKLSFTTIKYSFDVYLANSDLATKAMKEWMSSPEGFALSGLSAGAFITISLLANNFDKEDKNNFKRYTVILWPYARDSIKGLRNTYRGIQSTLTLMHLLDVEDLRHLIVPVSVLLGVATIVNRIWFRATSMDRRKMMEANASLLAEIKAAKELNSTQIHDLYSRIQEQSRQLRIQLLVSSALSGAIEGLNPYIGTLTVGFLSPSMLAVITAFCVIYFLATLMVKIYEEVMAQNRLMALEKEIVSALFEKEMFFVCPRPVEQTAPILIVGVKNGLTGYKYIMLTISTVLFLSPIKINSIEPINRAILGFMALVVSLGHAYMPSFQNISSDEKKELKEGQEFPAPLLKQEVNEVDLGSGKKEQTIEDRECDTGISKSSIRRNSFFANAPHRVKEFYQPVSSLSGCCIG